MRFMLMHKMTEDMENGVPPDPETMARIGQMIEDAVQQKVFISGEGLKPSAQRMRLTYHDGKRTISDGPFTEAKQLVAGFALVRVQSKEEALSWSDRFA